MARVEFDPQLLKRGLALARLVQPQTGDFILSYSRNRLSILSVGKRSFSRSEIAPRESKLPDDFDSGESYLSMDRAAVFDSDLEKAFFSFNEKGISVKMQGETQSRSASIKGRNDNTKRARMPARPDLSVFQPVAATKIESLLRALSYSAQVKKTKTELEMRVNQVHFYSDHKSAFSNANLYASSAYLEELGLDVSIVASDVPAMRTFCSKILGDTINVGQTASHLFIADPVTDSCIFFARVNSKRPEFMCPTPDGYANEIEFDAEQFSEALAWSCTAVEGTHRISFEMKTQENGTFLILSHKNQEVSTIPAVQTRGKVLKFDTRNDVLSGLATLLPNGKANLRFAHKTMPYLVEIASTTRDQIVMRHYVTAMPER